MPDTRWDIERDDGVVIAELPDGLPVDEAAFPLFLEEFERPASAPDVRGCVVVAEVADETDPALFDQVEEVGRVGRRHEVERFALVCESGSARESVTSVVSGLDGVETLGTADRAEAVEWAREVAGVV